MALPQDPGTILITCPKGIPPFLRGEVEALKFPINRVAESGVETAGSLADTMRLNLQLRTAHRVLFLLDRFRSQTADDLYARLRALPWENWITADGYLTVDSAVFTEAIRDARFVNQRAKDAIVDRFRERCGQRPDSGPDDRGACVFVYWNLLDCAVYLNTSGPPLSRRGYRQIPGRAPMQETLAAAVILATGWRGDAPFINPMCGSGTLAIEAALLAMNRAPGMLRPGFGFMHLKGFDPAAWKALRRDAETAARDRLAAPIIASDIDPRAVDAARRNARRAGVEHLIRFEVCDFADTPLPPEPGVIVLNPEYGERLGEARQLEPVYRRIGDFFKQKCLGHTGYVFSGNLDLAKRVGLRSTARIPFFNSRIECRLLKFALYAGTIRSKYRTQTETGDLGPATLDLGP